jgi:polyphenol oxidase
MGAERAAAGRRHRHHDAGPGSGRAERGLRAHPVRRPARIVAAAHAGWRGALAGIAESTIEAMVRLGARKGHIRAAIGPCIGPAVYEVGADFRADFLARDPSSERFFATPAVGARPHFDLPGYVADRLMRAEVAAERRTPCTYDDDGLFFSYRRSQVQKKADYGRQISAIVLT